ncbi:MULTISPECIES: UbiX family flavin prenyltransferase [Desulfotignum]|jgi:4-hydroxy-3-polyprenylbenzoate decarboxylase|uniref:Flavin prenyltransferase UbiX n=1 Tax=Desulfotignum phosphitoxidans DSM 13687 TaxID=1286635 RepID=S0FZF9_9BACT|nr:MULTISPECIES: UbiX family flavin prenyltransferase [Desulfotignum]EMS80050.1 3-octaprenyl-4-hydroxybenzoate carboxy-lyase UbiX [Desulfotignum phosphitoxidans DSM 13687]
MKNRLIVGIAGASGVIYGVRLLEVLKQTDIETHLIMSEAGKLNIQIETSYDVDDVLSMADVTYTNADIAASVASGSFQTLGMVIAPCTVKTLSGIANSFNENLLIRAADVQLKEKRKLALMFRETPLHIGHLRLLTLAAEMGAHIVPPVPAFYHHPETIDDIINQSVGKVLDYMGIAHTLFKRWDNSALEKLKSELN